MKKLVKLIVGVGAIVGGVAGVMYFLDKRKQDDFEDFNDDDFEDIFDEEEEDRDYVTLGLDREEEEGQQETETAQE